jgi:vitamin B12/bleomycin/antimicrobial peptide transport system ATP-binding/permease protein
MTGTARRVLIRFWRLARNFFTPELRWKSIGLLALLLTILLSINGLNVINNYVGGYFMTAVASRDAPGFAYYAWLYAGMFLAVTFADVCKRFCEERLALFWRDRLTRKLTARYLANRAYYRLTSRSDVDNPDQRITEDARNFTATTLSFAIILCNSTIAMIAFSGVLWSISPWVFFAAVGYAAFGVMTTLLLGKRLIGLNVLQLEKEADLRYDLGRVREHAEPIALAKGEREEATRLGGRLRAVVANYLRIIFVDCRLAFFTTGFNYLVLVVPVLIVAPLFIRGEVPFGSVTQAQMAFAQVIGAFSLMIIEFQRVSTFAAVVERLGAVWEATAPAAALAERQASAGPEIEILEDGRLAYEGLTVMTRGGHTLIKDLNLNLPSGQRLLVRGPDPEARRALVRATAGLWKSGTGKIHRPPLQETAFVSDRPYLREGTLRDQVVYGVPGGDWLKDEKIEEVLRQVGFAPVLERVGGLDAERDWVNILSMAEQQQLGFARLLLSEPRWAFLDEATSALPPTERARLYEHLADAGTQYVSVGNDPGLEEFHDLLLELRSDGAWKLVPAGEVAGREQPIGA